jgi:16S rRNA (cytidine1402-2'-O)-methyltransferase
VSSLQYFLVEEEKAARALIKTLCPDRQIRDLSILRIPETPTPSEVAGLMAPILEGHSIGVISEAGCPGIADPGAALVNFAHSKKIRVVPLVGPCSMVLALMASGLNGQAWRFVGYLPIEAAHRAAHIRELDERASTTGETQIIMETPYRNGKLLQELLQQCAPTTSLCVAQALTTSSEYIKTQSIRAWRGEEPKLEKLPCLFLLGRL